MSSAQTSFGTARSGGSTELCTASEKKLHLVAWSDGRSRSNRGSSSDEESQTHDGFIEEDFRAGGPYVCPLPAQITPFPPGRNLRLLQEESENIVQQISSVLDRFDVDYHGIGFYGRMWDFETEAEPVPTVVIEATKNSVDEDWISPSRGIWETLSQFGIRSISVEMCDERAFEPDRYHPVPQTDPIFPVWNTVSDTIIRECDVKGWNSLGCYRIGKNDDGALNPSTILVTVDDVDKDWRYTREDIVSILDRFRLHGVAVMIRKDEILQFSPLSKKPDLPETALDRNAQVGQSVARKGYHKGHGTFSGWVELLYPLDGQWYVYGLTCSHVVIPDDEPGMFPLVLSSLSASQLLTDFGELYIGLATYCVNGVPIGHEMVHVGLQVVSPCDTDLIEKKNSSTERAEKLQNGRRFCKLEEANKDPNGFLPLLLRAELNNKRQQIAILEEEVRKIDSFLIQNYQYLGYVRCATGSHKFKSHGQELPSVLDWALLSIPEWRQGDNKVRNNNS